MILAQVKLVFQGHRSATHGLHGLQSPRTAGLYSDCASAAEEPGAYHVRSGLRQAFVYQFGATGTVTADRMKAWLRIRCGQTTVNRSEVSFKEFV